MAGPGVGGPAPRSSVLVPGQNPPPLKACEILMAPGPTKTAMKAMPVAVRLKLLTAATVIALIGAVMVLLYGVVLRSGE